MRGLILAMPLTLLLGGCGGGSDAPKVSDRYQENIQAAWEKADQGEAPTNICARVVGTAVGQVQVSDDSRKEAVRAYEACYVDVQAHWVKRKIELAGADDSPCMSVMTGLMTGRMSLGTFADDLGLEVEALDAKIADMIEADVEEACPDQARSILGRKA